MFKLALVGTVLSSFASAKHPVHKEHLDKIKNDPTRLFVPTEVEENMFSSWPEEQVQNLLSIKLPADAVPNKIKHKKKRA
jgi:hypothetical protein